jgi:hypothetical protein
MSTFTYRLVVVVQNDDGSQITFDNAYEIQNVLHVGGLSGSVTNAFGVPDGPPAQEMFDFLIMKHVRDCSYVSINTDNGGNFDITGFSGDVTALYGQAIGQGDATVNGTPDLITIIDIGTTGGQSIPVVLSLNNTAS